MKKRDGVWWNLSIGIRVTPSRAGAEYVTACAWSTVVKRAGIKVI
jgi:hypothetical protein